jgi:hypothetical protein
MKALITKTKFYKEYESKFGTMYSHAVWYDDKKAFYTSKKKDQTTFVEGKEAEFTEETKYFKNNEGEQQEYLVIKPLNPNKQSNFGKALKKEQTRYSGFAVSYAKDLVIAGRIQLTELPDYATVLFELMVRLDKSIES